MSLSLLVLLVTSRSAAAQSLRYRWEPGDHLVYERRVETQPAGPRPGASTLVQQLEVWCFAVDDGAALLLLDVIDVADGRAGPMRGAVLNIDEHGRTRIPDECLTRLAALEVAAIVLPELPPAVRDGAAIQTAADFLGTQLRVRSRGADAAQDGAVRLDFTRTDPTGVAEVLGRSLSGSCWFDPNAGCLRRVETLEESRVPAVRRTGVVALRLRERRDPAWARRRAAETRRYQQTLRGVDRLCGEAAAEPNRLETILRNLDGTWSAFLADVDQRDQSPFATLGQAHIRMLPVLAATLRARADLARRWLAKSAVPFSLPDPAGTLMTSEALRNGVTIECFWSAAAPEGLRTLAALRRLQTEAAGKTVNIVCLNIDEDTELARRAIQRCGADLRHVLANPLLAADPLPEDPVLRVLDRAGIVRGVWFGWQPQYTAAAALAQQLAH